MDIKYIDKNVFACYNKSKQMFVYEQISQNRGVVEMQSRSAEDEFLYLIASKLCRATDRKMAVNKFCKVLKIVSNDVSENIQDNLLPLG